MKDLGVKVRGGVPVDRTAGTANTREGQDGAVQRTEGPKSGVKVDGDAVVHGPVPQAPDHGSEGSITVRTGRQRVSASGLSGRLPTSDGVSNPWQPNLQDKTERGLRRFTPVSTPWAPTFDEAVSAARHVRPLPNLSPSVRQAEQTFADMARNDPVGLANAYLSVAKTNQQRMVARLQGTLKAEVGQALQKVDPQEPDAVIEAAGQALQHISGLKPGSRAKLLEAFATRIREGGTVSEAGKAMLGAVHVPLKIETDEIKLMSPHFRGVKVDVGHSVYDGADAAKIGPAVFNTALHPTATAIARLAVELALKSTDGPLVVMAGGVAAGKGFAAKKANFDDSDAAIVFDPDGESSQTFLETVENLAAENGNEVRMVGVVTDPVAAWLRALNRSFEEGRTVSETAFSHSHSVGVENMITNARELKARGHDVVLIDNNAWPKLYEGEPPAPMGLQETYGRVKDITDALDRTGRVPDWVRQVFDGNRYMLESVIDPLEQKMQNPKLLQERKAIFDSLMEDRSVFEYAHKKV